MLCNSAKASNIEDTKANDFNNLPIFTCFLIKWTEIKNKKYSQISEYDAIFINICKKINHPFWLHVFWWPGIWLRWLNVINARLYILAPAHTWGWTKLCWSTVWLIEYALESAPFLGVNYKSTVSRGFLLLTIIPWL